VQSGKARYLGFSEWTPEQIQAAIDIGGPDLFVSSHGWTVSETMARAQYQKYFHQMQAVLLAASTGPRRTGGVG